MEDDKTKVTVGQPQQWPPEAPPTQAQYGPAMGQTPGGISHGAPPIDSPPPGDNPPGPPPSGYPPYYPPSPPQRSTPDRTVLIIILAIVAPCMIIAFIGIIATVMIPMLLSTRNNAIGEKAQDCLQSVVSAEAAYYDQRQEYATLQELVDQNYLDTRFSTGDLGSGIVVEVAVFADKTGYEATATSRTESYHTDQSGDIERW